MSDEKKVVALPSAAAAPDACAPVVALLDDLLAQARKGNLRAVGFAAVKADGTLTRGTALPDTGAHRNDLAAAVGDLFQAVFVERGDAYEFPQHEEASS